MKLQAQNEQGQPVLSCPNCRQITSVPASGVAGLQPAFHINHLLDIAEDLKREKEALASADRAKPPVSATERVDSSSPSPRKEVSTFCPEHVKEELKLYCETCGELICLHCVLNTGKHHSHNYALIEEVFETYKREIGALLEPINKQMTSVNEILTQFDKNNADISNQRAGIEADIHHTINELHQVLDNRRTELISHLHQLTQQKQKDLAAQKDQAETVHAQLSSCQDYMKQSLETDHWGEALRMKSAVLKQAKELTTTVQPDGLKPNTKADIIFLAPTDITSLCRCFGQVTVPSGSPDPSKCHIIGKNLEAGIVGQTSTTILQVCNSKGEPSAEPLTSLECNLVSEITGSRTTGSYKELRQNQYEISYQPIVKGRHQLHISIQGQHIKESPFHLAATSSSMSYRAPIHTIARVKGPYGIAINHKGKILVCEQNPGLVSTYHPSVKKIEFIDLRSLTLLGLTLDGEDNILITEDTKNSVRKYSPEGQLLASAGALGNGPQEFNSPRDVAVNPWNNKVYITDARNDRVQVLNSDLTFSASFGTSGKGKGQFNYPSAIACDSAGKLYVTDSANDRIQVFTANGEFVRQFGQSGRGNGELKWPIGIALDPSYKHAYVSESINNRISVFTRKGQFVTTFGAGVAAFDPRGLAVDSSGVVYVSDFSSNRAIQIF